MTKLRAMIMALTVLLTSQTTLAQTEVQRSGERFFVAEGRLHHTLSGGDTFQVNGSPFVRALLIYQDKLLVLSMSGELFLFIDSRPNGQGEWFALASGVKKLATDGENLFAIYEAGWVISQLKVKAFRPSMRVQLDPDWSTQVEAVNAACGLMPCSTTLRHAQLNGEKFELTDLDLENVEDLVLENGAVHAVMPNLQTQRL